MVLNFVAKLKYIGAQLARKSVRSPQMLLFHSLAPEVLASLSRSFSAHAGGSNGDSRHLRPSSWFNGHSTGGRVNSDLRSLGAGQSTNANSSTQSGLTSRLQQANSTGQVDAAALTQLNGLEIVSAVGSELESSQTSGTGSGPDEPSGDGNESLASEGKSKSGELLNQSGSTQTSNEGADDFAESPDQNEDPNDELSDSEEDDDDTTIGCIKDDCSDLLIGATEAASSTSDGGAIEQTQREVHLDPSATISYPRSESPPYIYFQNKLPPLSPATNSPDLSSHPINPIHSNEILDPGYSGQHEFIVRPIPNGASPTYTSSASAILRPDSLSIIQILLVLLILGGFVSLVSRRLIKLRAERSCQ